MLKLIVSNSYSDEYKYGINIISKMDKLKDHAIVLVPEHMTLQAELEIMNLLQVKGLFNVDVMNIRRFIRKFLPTREVLTPIGKRLILLNIIENKKKELKLYAKSSKNMGFIENLGRIIDEFRDNLIAPELLELLIAEVSHKHKLLKLKLYEIYHIYAQYYESLKADLYDENKLMQEFISKLRANEIIFHHHVFVDGFSDMNVGVINFLAELEEFAPDMQIRIVQADENTPMNAHIERFQKLIINGFYAQGVDVKLIKVNAESNAFCTQMNAIFTDKLLSEHKIQLYSSQSMYDEIKNAVFDIVMKCKKNGRDLSEFAILCENIALAEHMIKQICDEFQIPYYISDKNSLINHDYCDFILSSLQVILKRYSRDSMLRLLKNKFMQMSYKSIALFKKITIELDVNSLDKWKRIEELAHKLNLELDCEDLNKVKSLLENLVQLSAQLKKSKGSLIMIQALKKFISKFEINLKLQEFSDLALETGNLEYAQELTQVYEIADDIFNQIELVDEFEISPKNLYDLLKYAFEELEIGVLPQRANSIFFGDFKSSKLGKINTLYCINMSEGVVPKKVEEDGFFTFAERDVLCELNLLNIKDYSYEHNLSAYNIYENMLGVTESVYWSYPLIDDDNMPNLPSIWYDTLRMKLGIENVKCIELSEKAIEESGLENLYFDVLLDKLLHHEYLNSDQYQYFNWFLQNDKFSAKFKSAMSGQMYKNEASLDLDRLDGLKLYGNIMNTSVSALEQFARCPYKYFIDHSIRPSRIEDFNFNPMDIGNLFHDIFEKIMNYMSKFEFESFGSDELEDIIAVNKIQDDKIPSGLSPDVENLKLSSDTWSNNNLWDEEFERHYAQILQENIKFGLNQKNIYFAKRFKEILKTSVKYSIIQLKLTKFKNLYNEMSFGNMQGQKGMIDSLELINDGFKKVYIRGKIDRVDIAKLNEESDEHYIRIIDYKTGATEFKNKLFDAGLSLQLPIYLDMVLNSDKLKQRIGSMKAYGAFYFVIPADIFLEQKSQQELISEFKLNGIVLEDEIVNFGLDMSLSSDLNKSLVASLSKNKEGKLKSTKNMMSADAIKNMLELARHKATQIAQQIYSADISIAPVGNLLFDIPCNQCDYKDICKFDTNDKRQRYRML